MVHHRSVLPRALECCVCGATIDAQSATTTDPEAPELLQLPPVAWSGVVRDEPSGEVRIIACCSDRCLGRLLVED